MAEWGTAQLNGTKLYCSHLVWTGKFFTNITRMKE
jgi:hypothetical protein